MLVHAEGPRTGGNRGKLGSPRGPYPPSPFPCQSLGPWPSQMFNCSSPASTSPKDALPPIHPQQPERPREDGSESRLPLQKPPGTASLVKARDPKLSQDHLTGLPPCHLLPPLSAPSSSSNPKFPSQLRAFAPAAPFAWKFTPDYSRASVLPIAWSASAAATSESSASAGPPVSQPTTLSTLPESPPISDNTGHGPHLIWRVPVPSIWHRAGACKSWTGG